MGRSIHPGAESHLFKTSELVENRAFITTDETPLEMCWDDEILPIQCRWEVFAGLSHTFRLFLGEGSEVYRHKLAVLILHWHCCRPVPVAFPFLKTTPNTDPSIPIPLYVQ